MLFSNRSLPTPQLPFVVGSGWYRKEAMAASRVSRGSRSFFDTMMLMQIAFDRLHESAAIMIVKLNSSLCFSSMGGLRRYCIGVATGT